MLQVSRIFSSNHLTLPVHSVYFSVGKGLYPNHLRASHLLCEGLQTLFERHLIMRTLFVMTVALSMFVLAGCQSNPRFNVERHAGLFDPSVAVVTDSESYVEVTGADGEPHLVPEIVGVYPAGSIAEQTLGVASSAVNQMLRKPERTTVANGSSAGAIGVGVGVGNGGDGGDGGDGGSPPNNRPPGNRPPGDGPPGHRGDD